MTHIMTCRLAAMAAGLMSGLLCVAAAPGQPELTMTFETHTGGGVVMGSLTAPVTDTQSNQLPADARMDITVYRSAYSLGQNNLVVERFQGMSPGSEVKFRDAISPAWEYNQQYTYSAEVTLPGYNFYLGYSNMRPGIEFNFEKDAFTLAPSPDGSSVVMSAVVPHRDVDGLELTVDIAKLDFYRAVDTSSWPYRYELIHSEKNPEPKSTVTYTDPSPRADMTNYYKVCADTGYGYAELTASCYVGLDSPAAPLDVAAVSIPEGAHITWTAPEHGENWGYVDPGSLSYNVYRCWGYSQNERELVGSSIAGTSFTDAGDDMEAPLAVRYAVEAVNMKGTGPVAYSGYDYDIIIGPAYTLPFSETFDGGMTKEWLTSGSSYYAQWYMATEGEYGSRPIRVRPQQGSGLLYVDYIYNSPASGTTNTLTSYKIDMSGADNPYISFWYYAIPDNDVTITLDCSADAGGSYGQPVVIRIADDVEKAEWRRALIPLTGMAGSAAVIVRFTTSFLDEPSSAMLDNIEIMDYPRVAMPEVDVDEENLSATISWTLPEGGAECLGFNGYMDGELYGAVESPWIVEGLERDRIYTFSVQPLYADVEVAPSDPCRVMIETPAETAFTEGDYDYEVILPASGDDEASATPGEVVIVKYHGHGGLLRLPAAVEHSGLRYDVKSIGAEAFSGNTVVESVAIPEGYVAVRERAFMDCSSLMALSLPATLTEIGEMAFAGCGSLRTVAFSGQVPPATGKDAFRGIHADCKGSCPEGSAEAYVEVEELKPIDFGFAGIRMIAEGDVAEVEWYDMAGRRIPARIAGTPCVARIRLTSGEVRIIKVTGR